MIDSSDSPELRTVSTKGRWTSLRLVSSSNSVKPSTPFMGVRISWLMLARNSDLARLACSAASLAASSSCSFWRSACSASARGVMSKNTV